MLWNTKKRQKNPDWINKSWGHGTFWRWFSKFLYRPFTILYIILQDFLNQWNYFFPLLDDFLRCGSDLSIEYFDVHSFTVYKMGLMASLVFLTFSFYAKSNTLFIMNYLPLYLGAKCEFWVNFSTKNFSCVYTLLQFPHFQQLGFFIRATNKIAFISIN